VLAPSGTPLADAASVLIPIDSCSNIDPYTRFRRAWPISSSSTCWRSGWRCSAAQNFRRKMQNAQKALQEFDMQFDSFIG